MKKSALVTAINTLILASLTACGGGGGGGSAAAPENTTPAVCDAYSTIECTAHEPAPSTSTQTTATDLTVKETDLNNNVRKILVYNNKGLLTSKTEGSIIKTYTYNTQDLLESSVQKLGNTTMFTTTYNHNADGKLSTETLVSSSTTKKTSYTYENGKLKTKSIDNNGDDNIDINNTLDETITYFYKDGNLVKAESNNPNTGHKLEYTYDCNGNNDTITTTKNSDGTTWSIEKLTYDKNNNVVTKKIEGVNQSVDNERKETRFFCSNEIASVSKDTNGDGLFNSIIKNAYDSNNNLVKTVENSNGDHTFDKAITISYEGDLSIISKIKD